MGRPFSFWLKLPCHQQHDFHTSAMYPSQAAALQMSTIREMKEHYALPEDLWRAFVAVAGEPGDDPRLLAVLPSHVVSEALERATLADGSPPSAVQASHVGLIYNLAKRVQHTKGGGDWNAWLEASPFGPQRKEMQAAAKAPSSPTSTTERKMKMTQILDQGDDVEFVVQGGDARAAWYQQYVATVGGWPPEEEDPTLEQLSALHRRISIQDTAPYVDFAIYVPFGHRALKASRFRTYVLTSTGYTTKELPGPATFTQWRTCFRLFRTSLIMLDAAGLAALHGYEMAAERLSRTYPTAWHLIYAADEVARSSQSNRLRSKIMMDIRAGKAPPEGYDQNRPWDHIYNMLAKDENFWRTQVHTPALAWIASGSQQSRPSWSPASARRFRIPPTGERRGNMEGKEEGKEAQVRNASPGTTETRHVGSLHRGSNAQQR